jgi:O-antigen ligase
MVDWFSRGRGSAMPGLVLIVAVALLVWGAVVFFRGGLLGGCLAFLLAATCFGPDFAGWEVGPLRLSLDRVLWPVLIFQYLVWHWRGWDDPKPLRPPDVALFALVGYLALRTFTSDWQADGSSPAVRLVLSYVMPLGVYWVARQSRPSARNVAAVLACLTLFGLYLAVTVAAEYFQAYWLVWPRYIVATLSDKKLDFIGRGRGPLLNPMVTGILLAACWSAAILGLQRARRLGSAALLPVSLLFAVAVWSTMTRSVWIGAGLSVALVAGALMPRRWRLPVLGGALLAAVLVVGTHWEEVVAFKRDRDLTARETASSVYLRPVLAVVAWNMFLDHPLFGCGFDQYSRTHREYLADRSTPLVLETARGRLPHNVFMAVLAETGLVGLGLFLSLLALWAWDAWKLWRGAATNPPLSPGEGWGEGEIMPGRRSPSPPAPLPEGEGRLMGAPLPKVEGRVVGLLFLATLAAYLVNGAFHHLGLLPMSNALLFFLAGITAAWRSAAPDRPSLSPGPAGG